MILVEARETRKAHGIDRQVVCEGILVGAEDVT
jgi:hypothetical protein